MIRPPQDVGVLAVLYFQNPCYRPETPGFYPRWLLTKPEDHGRNDMDHMIWCNTGHYVMRIPTVF